MIASFGASGGKPAAAFAAAPPHAVGDSAEALRRCLAPPGGAAICLPAAFDAHPDALPGRLVELPTRQAAEGGILERGYVYRQDARRPLVIERGRFRPAAPAPRLGARPRALLDRIAELADSACGPDQAVRRVMQCVAGELGWWATSYRLLEDATAVSLGESAVAGPPPGSPPPLLLVAPVRQHGQLLLALVFTLPRAELDCSAQRLLQCACRRLAAAIARCPSLDQRLRCRSETIRQGRLSGMADLADSLAIDLSQPLAAAMNYAGALRRSVSRGELGAAEAERLIEKLEGQVRRAGNILHSTQDAAARHAYAPRPVDLGESVRAALKRVERQLRGRKVTPSLVLEDGLPPVQADAAGLERILLMLLGQALASLDEAPRRRMPLRVRRRGAQLSLGIGGGPLAADPAAFADSVSLARALGGRLRMERTGDGRVNFVLALPVSA